MTTAPREDKLYMAAFVKLCDDLLEVPTEDVLRLMAAYAELRNHKATFQSRGGE